MCTHFCYQKTRNLEIPQMERLNYSYNYSINSTTNQCRPLFTVVLFVNHYNLAFLSNLKYRLDSPLFPFSHILLLNHLRIISMNIK